MKLNTLIIFSLFISFRLFGISNLEFERLNSNNGLSSEEIRDIFQGSDGYLWFLTNEGLNRYDGYSFKVYKPGTERLDFTTSYFESICEDEDKRLWLGTAEKGLLIFDRHNHSVVPFEIFSGGQIIDDPHIRTLLADDNNNIWIGTEYGLYRYDITNNKLSFFNLGNLNADEPSWCIIESMIEDKVGNIWIGTWNMGLFKFDQKEEDFTNFTLFNRSPSTAHENRIKSLFEDKYGNIWVGTWEDGLYQTYLSGDELVINKYFLYDNSTEQSISGDIIYSINQDEHENLWIGTPYGLCIIENLYSQKPYFNNISYEFASGSGLSNNEVWKIYRDESGLMWLGTLEGGANKVHPGGKIFEGSTIPPVSPQIYSQTIQSFCLDPAGKLLIGIKSLGFGFYDLSKKLYVPYILLPEYDFLPTDINTVNCFINENNQYLWLGTRYNGLIVCQNDNRTFIRLNDLDESFTNETVNVLYRDRDGSVWVGTEECLYHINRCDVSPNCFEIKRINELENNSVFSIIQIKNGDILIGTADNGIYLLEEKQDLPIKITRFNVSAGNIPTDRVLYLYANAADEVWVGTADQGLLQFNPASKSFEKLNIFKGQQTNVVYGITEDQRNNLWLSTNNGLVRLIKENDLLTFDSYTIADGLQGNIFVRGAIFQQNNNRIFVGGYYGFNSFFPSDVKSNKYKPATAITDILINNEPFQYNLESKQPIILPYTENDLTFIFSANSFYKSEKNTYAYKLDGFDADWQYVDATNRNARFPNLDAGQYTFQVKSANSSELWNEDPVTIQLKILPAPYKTWWAYSGYGIGALALLVLLFRFLIKNEKVKHDLQIEKIEHAKSEKLNQFKLRFFTNISHEILTPLSIISCSLDLIKSRTRKSKEEFEIADRNINQLNRLLHQLLDFRKMEGGHLKLQVEKGDINEFIRNIVTNFYPLANQKNLNLSVKINGKYTDTWFDSDKLDKILDNLISNAIKYTPDGGSVLITSELSHKNGQLRSEISVIDTGQGIKEQDFEKIFSRFYRAESGADDTGTGIGLAFTRNLIELHKGTISVSSNIGEGSRFTVSLPLDHNYYMTNEIRDDKNLEEIIVDEQYETNQLSPLISGNNKMTKDGKNITILLVDDNSDFRAVMSNYLSKTYLVIEATNGEDALKKAISKSPHLIISDVMMPVKNGFELCRDLKNHIDTRQIPVILLTAKTDENARSRGYNIGADSYISKPVSLKVIESRIISLLLKSAESNPDIIILPKRQYSTQKLPDHVFLKKLEAFIKSNLSDPELSVKTIAQHFAMSDSMLFRQVKRVSSMAPVEIIKRVRLNEAALLLKKNDAPISEVAFNAGFSDQSYFTSCFKKQFGLTPSKYAILKSN